MSEIMTYEKLYELLRKEKYSSELQILPETFFQDTITYLEEKRKIIESQESKDSVFNLTELEKTKKQLENTRRIIKELYERRERKIMELAIFISRSNSKLQDSSPLLKEEKRLFDLILDGINKFRSGILYNILASRLPKISEIEPKDLKIETKNTKRLIRFLQPTPKFTDQDLNIYGPFEEEDTANLPKEIANILIKNKKAEQIKPR